MPKSFTHRALDQILATKMLTLWAMAVMLSVHVEALGGLAQLLPVNVPDLPMNAPNLPVDVPNLPVNVPNLHVDVPSLPMDVSSLPVNVPSIPIDVGRNLPANLPSLPNTNIGPIPQPPQKSSPTSTKNSPKKDSAETTSEDAAVFSMSAKSLEEHMNNTMPQIIQNMIMSQAVDMVGQIGTVLKLISDGSLTSALPLPGIGGGDLLKGVGLPGLSGSQPASGAEKKSSGNLLGGVLPLGEGLPLGVDSLQDGPLKLPVKDLVGKATKITDSTDSVLSKGVTSQIKDTANKVASKAEGDTVGNLLSTLDLEGLLTTMKVTDVTVESMSSKITDDKIHINAAFSANIGGDSAIGTVMKTVGFTVNGDVCIEITMSTENTTCPTLQAQMNDIKINKVSMPVLESILDVVPAGIPDLSSKVADLLTVQLKSKSDDVKSEDSAFGDFFQCKNSTGPFTYQLTRVTLSEKGIAVHYSANFTSKEKTTPVPGSSLPSIPENANYSLTLSHNLIKEIVTYTAKTSSSDKSDHKLLINKVMYTFSGKDQMKFIIFSNIVNQGFSTGEVRTMLPMSFKSSIENNEMVTVLKPARAEHNVIPPEAMEEENEIINKAIQIFSSALQKNLKQINIPLGITDPFPLNNTPFEKIKMDFQASN